MNPTHRKGKGQFVSLHTVVLTIRLGPKGYPTCVGEGPIQVGQYLTHNKLCYALYPNNPKTYIY